MLTGDVPFKGENQIAVAMRHVREQLPDVQLRRPEVSAALAAVLERSTSKELDRRYPDARAMVADLEEVLAIETARSGQITGEATTVLKSLPDKTRRRVPWSARRSARAFFALIAAAVAVAAVLAYVAADNTERGTGKRASAAPPPPPGIEQVALPQRAASDFDPLGDDGHEHPDQTSALVDGIATSTWSTERYKGNTLSKAGVGVIIDAAPVGVAASQLEVQTPTPGFEATVYVAAADTPETAPPAGWTKAGPTGPVLDGEKIDLDTAGNRFRRYLLWITKLPPGEDKVQISEILLYK
jgi:serine/threonine-protein kinase